MKINLLAACAFAAALAMPLGAHAQQYQQGQGQYAGHRSSGTPSPARLQRRWAKRFGRLNLSGDQQQRIQGLINQYSQSHPEGSPRDPGATRELRRQIMSTLSPDQQNQIRQQMRAHHAHRAQAQGGYQQGGYQQGYPDQRYQQGPQDQQYQQGPQDQQYQQGPQDQQYQQGPPQYQQGPPQYQQGPPSDPRYQQGPPDQYQQPGPDQQDEQGPPA
jgi:hypothetical protein